MVVSLPRKVCSMPDTDHKVAGALGTVNDYSLSPAELAARHGLVRSTARPTLGNYIRELWARRPFIFAYASARSTAMYSQSHLGQLWQVMTPLLQAGVYFLIFGLLLKMSRGIENYPAFLVTGVFAFTFMQRSMSNGAKSVGGNLQLIRALHFPRAVLPLSFVLVEFKQLFISMGVLFVFISIVGVPISWSWLLVLPVMLLQMLFNIGLSLTMARIGASTADINQLLPFVTRVWFYTSGVFFSISRFTDGAPEWVQHVLTLNPGAAFLDLYRGVLIDTHVPLEMPWGLNVWLVCATWSLLLLAGGFTFFWLREERYGRG